MAKKTIQELKDKFKTGMFPTQSDYEDVFDSILTTVTTDDVKGVGDDSEKTLTQILAVIDSSGDDTNVDYVRAIANLDSASNAPVGTVAVEIADGTAYKKGGIYKKSGNNLNTYYMPSKIYSNEGLYTLAVPVERKKVVFNRSLEYQPYGYKTGQIENYLYKYLDESNTAWGVCFNDSPKYNNLGEFCAGTIFENIQEGSNINGLSVINGSRYDKDDTFCNEFSHLIGERFTKISPVIINDKITIDGVEHKGVFARYEYGGKHYWTGEVILDAEKYVVSQTETLDSQYLTPIGNANGWVSQTSIDTGSSNWVRVDEDSSEGNTASTNQVIILTDLDGSDAPVGTIAMFGGQTGKYTHGFIYEKNSTSWTPLNVMNVIN